MKFTFDTKMITQEESGAAHIHAEIPRKHHARRPLTSDNMLALRTVTDKMEYLLGVCVCVCVCMYGWHMDVIPPTQGLTIRGGDPNLCKNYNVL